MLGADLDVLFALPILHAKLVIGLSANDIAREPSILIRDQVGRLTVMMRMRYIRFIRIAIDKRNPPSPPVDRGKGKPLLQGPGKRLQKPQRYAFSAWIPRRE